MSRIDPRDLLVSELTSSLSDLQADLQVRNALLKFKYEINLSGQKEEEIE